jgi:diaminohydroxyphosphoribosylaminopyrimidine deaminase/5-amino-6-(5-phosphoribosylamino)uracil reductase
VDALSKLPDPSLARGATAVVTLEPCNHTGRTGPCSEALLAAGIARVVFAIPDPGRLAGGGAQRLRDAGVEVLSGVLAADAERFLADWLFATRHGRPFVTLKWAASLDGRTAASTGSAARRRVHEQRRASDAILVGTGTVFADDPTLTARADDGALLDRQPTPVVLGEREIPAAAAVRRHPHAPILLRTRDIRAALAELHARGLRTVYVEAGQTLASAFVAQGLVDEFVVFVAPTLIGGPRTATGVIGLAAIGEQRRLELTSVERVGDDIMIVARPREA